MVERAALIFKVKPGTEDTVAEIFSRYGRPESDIDENNRLISTSIFMHGTTVVRVVEYEGDLVTIMRHLSNQEVIQAVERELDPYLEEHRDMSSLEGARAFFMKAMMRRVTHRVAGEPMQ